VNDIARALEPVARVCERLRIRMQVGGSVATSTFGVARTTLDVDIVIDLKPGQVSRFVRSLEDDYMIEVGAVRGAVQRKASFNLIHQETVIKVDVFVPQEEGFVRESFERGVRDTLETDPDAREFVFATPEDMILHKLVWFELGGRVASRQLDDVRGVVEVLGKRLDWDYIDKWADELGVESLVYLVRSREP